MSKKKKFISFNQRKISFLLFVTLIFLGSHQAQNRNFIRKRYKYDVPSLQVTPHLSQNLETNIDPDPYPWPESTPEDQGLDSSILIHAFERAHKLGFINSILIIRNGHLIRERYFNQKDKYFADHICSASKSYLNPLIAIALDQNFLTGLDQKLVDFFPEYITHDMDPRIFDITIAHLLKMRAGYSLEERDEFNERWLESDNWIRFAFECQLVADPGQTYAYSTLSSHLLSGIITKATGMSTFEFAKQYLFDPVGITIQRWDQDPQGYYTGGWRMFSSPRDMARFGHIFLNNGLVDGTQILPASWIEESTRKYSDNVTWFQKHFTKFGYGYQWWLAKASGYSVYFAGGHGGQNILIIPELNMIIVTTAKWEITPSQSGVQINVIYDLIANYILSPIRCLNGPPPYFPAEVSAQKVRNQGLAYREYINVLRWQPNPRNAGMNITTYRIYKRNGEHLRLLDEVNTRTFEYWDRDVNKYENYTYAISAVTEDNQESIPFYVSAFYPTG